MDTTESVRPVAPPIPPIPENASELVETLAWPERPTCHDGGEHDSPIFRYGQTEWWTRGRYRFCSYCGSVHPHDLARVLLSVVPAEYPPLPPEPHKALTEWYETYQHEHDGAEPSQKEFIEAHNRTFNAYYDAKRGRIGMGGSDWKYGWPHKLYIDGVPDMVKWYNEHLLDLDGQAFDLMAALIEKFAHIHFFTFPDKPGRLFYRAPHHGYQAG